jgi:acyl carrier protein
MDRTALRQALIELVEQQTDVRYDNLADEQNLRDSLGIDSVDLINLVMQVEDRFKIRIETEEMMPLQKVGDLLDLLQTKIAASARPAAA